MNTLRAFAETGRSLAGLRLEAVLARGRQSIVYLARSSVGDRDVALKVARKSARSSHAPDFKREAATLATLAHAQVVDVLDSGVAGDEAWLAMEYAAGGSLARQRGPLDRARTFAVMTEAARALAWIHRQGWVHRDVKPANLLLRADGSLALGDFGCACRRGHEDALPEGTVTGTPRYAAPEQSRGAAAEAAADVYSLGACLYEMLTAQPLYPGMTPTELLGQHLLAAVPRLPPAQAEWQPLIDAMLAKDPDQRPAEGEAVLSLLQRLERSRNLS